MSHYGYVSEQLLAGELFPTRSRDRRVGAGSRGDASRERRRASTSTGCAATSTSRPPAGWSPTTRPPRRPPRELVDLYRRLSPWYESVHRGQSAASQQMTARFEESFDTIATWINAPGRAHHRDLPEHHRGHQRGDVLAAHRVPRRRQRGDHADGAQLQLRAVVRPVPRRCCRGSAGAWSAAWSASTPRPASWTSPTWPSWSTSAPRSCASAGRPTSWGPSPRWAASARSRTPAATAQPDGTSGSLLLVDAAQLAPEHDHRRRGHSDVDYLAFSFHKVLAPFGVGVLYAKEHLLERSLPFLYGGDMVAEGGVTQEHVEYGALPWKFSAGTPNVLGVIASAQALRLLVDLALDDGTQRRFEGEAPLARTDVEAAMGLVHDHVARPHRPRAGAGRGDPGPPGLRAAPRRATLTAAGVHGHGHRSPRARRPPWTERGVEARAGCHCASLAHRHLGLERPGTCRLSFAAYTSERDVDRAMTALTDVVRSG